MTATSVRRAGARTRSATARRATQAAVAGLVLLVVMELSALSLYEADKDSTSATVIATLFLLPVMLIGVGRTAAEGGWMLMFAVLGYGLTRLETDDV